MTNTGTQRGTTYNQPFLERASLVVLFLSGEKPHRSQSLRFTNIKPTSSPWAVIEISFLGSFYYYYYYSLIKHQFHVANVANGNLVLVANQSTNIDLYTQLPLLIASTSICFERESLCKHSILFLRRNNVLLKTP